MKVALLCILSIAPFFTSAQKPSKTIQRAWIKIEIENLSCSPLDPDTMYIRYTFDRNKVNVSFYPAWDDKVFDWNVDGKNLTLGYDTYVIEELTDSVFIFSLKGFRRFKLVAEEKWNLRKIPDTVKPLNGETVYRADTHVTPRYRKNVSFMKAVDEHVANNYGINRKNTFIARFVVTREGKIERVVVDNPIVESFGEDFVDFVKSTQKSWTPAKINGVAVNAELTYTIRYLDSIIR